MPVGKEIPISPEEFDHSPVFRVVVKVVEEMLKEGAKLYVLLEEKDGLSVPYRVAQSKVFFFDEFRDDSPSRARREVSWMANVKKHSVMEKRARDTSKLACGPKEDLRNSLAKHLVLLMTIYGHVSERHAIERNNRCLCRQGFSLGDQTCTSNFISAIKRVWPSIQLTEEIAHALRTGLREAELSVDYRHLKWFLIEGSFIIENEIQAPGVARTMTNEEVAIAALSVAQRHKQVDTAPRPSIQTVQDNEACVDSWTAFFKGHSGARDRDAQKMLSASLARSMFSQITIKHDGRIKILEEMIRLTEMWLSRASQH
ncbi:hypothetical protein BTUL_0040g00140 [Botrytis tulipae]|uniref:Uncharacterized protein n=1 Tax=Botrytis tulipae TaxID=87230 RepID=A0A4Z1EWG7_9HELO|nr:hypothetical protein BTUL_0040g00140 [Botrytis tulipae]